ncbi:hypothetical protein JYQ62_37790 [Nostoc sp. UHCC 0702]|nr:hypothetical protein JYQ62_37790 [Nostoc sp. UHCC 0702]
MGRWGDGGEIITNYQLPITNYQLPIPNSLVSKVFYLHKFCTHSAQ